jgi:NADPH:quinone reductase-like Zn-dependent oxidoreductase
MKKVLIRSAGGYDRLELVEAESGSLAAGEVRVEVEAIGVNFADVIIRMGLYSSAKEYVGWPITPGFEFSGRVVEVAAGVEGFEVGQAVLGLTRFGAYASEVCVPAHQLFALPEGYSMEEAAGFQVVFLTAYYALHRLCLLSPGQRVLVHSAAGGVGGALLQLAKLAGLASLGVVGASHKVEAARTLGATEVVDKSTEDLWARAEAFAPEGFDAVFDANGVSTLRESYRHLAPEGRLVVYGFHTMFPRRGGRPNWLQLALSWLRTPRFDPFQLVERNRAVMGFNLSYLFGQEALLGEVMGVLLDHAAAGRLEKPTVTAYPLAEVARAHADLESGATVGKLILVP